MADNMIGGGGSLGNVLANLIQNAENNQAQQSATQSADDADRDALQQRLAKQALLKQQQNKDHISHEHTHQALRKDAIDKRLGPGVAEWAGAEALQKKLTAKQKELFLKQAETGDPKANRAGEALATMSQSPNFARAVPNAAAAGELQAMVMKKPDQGPALQRAIDSRFMGDKGADAAAKQGFLRFAARGDNRGISIKMGGDMLGALSGSQLPGFAQRAAMKMIDRNSDNVRGVENVQDFVEAPQVRAMPTMARGRATEVLAKGDGTDEVRQGLEDVAGAEGFRGLPRSDKARLFATIGQGKASELRAITDQTLVALRTANFPTQSAQVSRFLGGLSRQIAKGNGTGQDIDPKALLRQAKRGNMPAMPKLLSTVDNDDEEAQSQARSHNRAALMRYYSQVSEHYDGIEGQIKNAKYFEDVNLLTGLKQAALPDTQGILKVSDEARADVEGEMGQLNQALANRTLTRPDYMAQVRALQTKALGRADLTADEKTWVGVVTADALNAQTFQDLAGKKNRKLREVGKNLMPAAKRRRLGQERRTVSAQPRYFRAGEADGKQGAARLATLPLPGRQPGAQGTSGMNPNVEAQLRQLVTGLQQLLSSGGKQDLGQKLAKLTQGLSQGAGAPQSPAPTKRPVASKAGTQGKTDGWGIPRTFERDLGATANVVPVRAAEGKDSASSPPGYDTAVGASPPSYSEATAGDVPPDYETPRSETAQVNVVRANAKLRDLSTLYGLPWKQLTKDESNVFRNLGWDMATWNAKGQPGARLPVSLRTTFSSLSPKERSSVQALGFSQSEWDAYVEGVSGQ